MNAHSMIASAAVFACALAAATAWTQSAEAGERPRGAKVERSFERGDGAFRRSARVTTPAGREFARAASGGYSDAAGYSDRSRSRTYLDGSQAYRSRGYAWDREAGVYERYRHAEFRDGAEAGRMLSRGYDETHEAWVRDNAYYFRDGTTASGVRTITPDEDGAVVGRTVTTREGEVYTRENRLGDGDPSQ